MKNGEKKRAVVLLDAETIEIGPLLKKKAAEESDTTRKIRNYLEMGKWVLFQPPPRWNVNLDRLRVYRLLSEREAAFCVYDFDRRQSPKELTAEFVYIRLHGPKGLYKGQYDSRSQPGWAGVHKRIDPER
jgi:uncharacterized protein YecE (DUF72 family)